MKEIVDKRKEYYAPCGARVICFEIIQEGILIWFT